MAKKTLKGGTQEPVAEGKAKVRVPANDPKIGASPGAASPNFTPTVAGELAERAGDAFGEFTPQTSAEVRDLREQAGESWGDVRERARRYEAAGRKHVRDNPAKAVLTALGVGFFLGQSSRH